MRSGKHNALLAAAALAGILAMSPTAVCDEVGPVAPPTPGQFADKQDMPVRTTSQADGIEGGQVRSTRGRRLPGFLQTLLALALVVVLVFAVRILLKRYGAGSQSGQSDQIQLLTSRSVGSKSQLLLVRFGGKLLLLGVGPSGPSKLCEASDPQEAIAAPVTEEGAAE